MKTFLYNFDPLKLHFYIVKLGFTGVYTIFFILFLLKNIDCGYSLEPPRRGGSNTSTHNLCFEQKYNKYQNFLSENFLFLVVKFLVYLNRRVFVMDAYSDFDVFFLDILLSTRKNVIFVIIQCKTFCCITKTHLFKYIENFTTKTGKFLE